MSELVELGIPELPGLSAPSTPITQGIVIHHDRTYVLTVVNAGLACCSIEFVSAIERWGTIENDAQGEQVLVVSGTCTTKIAPLVTQLFAQMPPGSKVVSFGACTASGGPYWDSYSVIPGIGELVPVDLYIPGCPPRPEALLHGLTQLFEDAQP